MDRQGWADKRIAVLGENSYPWALTYFAVLYLGAVIVPLDKGAPAPSRWPRRSPGPRPRCWCTRSPTPRKPSRPPGWPAGSPWCPWSLGGQALSLPELVERGCAPSPRGGRPRRATPGPGRALRDPVHLRHHRAQQGVTLSQRNLAANVRMACQLVTYRPDDVMLSILPMHHTYEAMAGLLCRSLRRVRRLLPGPKALPALPEAVCPHGDGVGALVCADPASAHLAGGAKRGLEGKLRLGIGLCNALAKIGVDLRGRVLRAAREGLGGRLRRSSAAARPWTPL